MRPKTQLVLKDSALSKPSPVAEFLRELEKSESVSGYHHIRAREPRLVDFPPDLDARLRHSLKRRGIEKLYSHQAAAFDLTYLGWNVHTIRYYADLGSRQPKFVHLLCGSG